LVLAITSTPEMREGYEAGSHPSTTPSPLQAAMESSLQEAPWKMERSVSKPQLVTSSSMPEGGSSSFSQNTRPRPVK
jgi:hypothetical protein